VTQSSLMGASLNVPVRQGQLAMGTWQGLYLNEHRNHGGSRKVCVTIQGQKRSDGRKYQSCMHLTTFIEFCLDFVVSHCYKHALQQLLCAFKAFLAFSARAVQSEVKCGLSQNQAHLFNDVALRDCQNCQIGRPCRDAQDRQLWRDCTYMSWKV